MPQSCGTVMDHVHAGKCRFIVYFKVIQKAIQKMHSHTKFSGKNTVPCF